jgi:hypothetical protein
MTTNRFINFDFKTLTDDEIRTIGFLLLKWFKFHDLGNPFNYNRFMEFIQAKLLNYKLTKVGGGSDAINEQNETTEFKGTEFLGFSKKSVERSHSFSYNGTTRKPTLEEQKKYCYQKIMRDPLHHWSMIDYENGAFIKTIQLTNDQVWQILWTKWEKSWYNSKAADPRIGASISTAELDKAGIKYITITH